MLEIIKHIMLIDDRVEEDRRDNYVAEAYKSRFHDAKFTMFSSSYEAIRFLEDNDPADHPNVLVLDCCDTGLGFDTWFGFNNANDIIDWHLEHAPDLPRYVLFQSSDDEYAIRSALNLEDETGIKCFSVDRSEYLLVKQFMDQRSIRRDNVKLSGFRDFLNVTSDLGIPTTKETLHKWQVENEIWEEEDIIEFAREGLISRDKALSEIHEETMSVVNGWLDPKIEIEVNDEDGTLSRRDIAERRWQAEQLCFEFKKAVGESVHGYLAFSLDDVKNLAKDGKKSVLVLSEYDGSFVPYLSDLAGVVLIANNATGHMSMLLESHGVTGLLGLETLGDHFNYLRDPNSNIVTQTQRIEGEGNKRLLASYQDTIIDQANAHSKPHYPEDGIEEGEPEPDIPVLTIDMDAMDADYTISNGDAVTLHIRHGAGSIYAGHHKIIASDAMRYNDWIRDVSEFLTEWNDERNIKPLRFKVNIDHPDQAHDQHASAIGLLRTEHFVLSNTEQHQALKDFCLNDNAEALSVLSNGLNQDLRNFLQSGTPSPTRIRLLDVPLSEFYSDSEQKILQDRYGVDDSRGVQLATQLPELYEAQLDGLFGSMKAIKAEACEIYGDDDGFSDFPLGVEVLIPTVRTAEELCFAKQMTEKVAEKYEVPNEKYRFGSMLETIEACDNIEDIIVHCDFISIGTNDLTSEVLKIERDDWETRNEYVQSDGFDPFVTLHPDVLKKLQATIEKVRKVKPDIQIDLCGAHATNLPSLEMLRPLELDGVSLPNSQKNIIGTRLQYKYAPFLKENGIVPEKQVADKPATLVFK